MVLYDCWVVFPLRQKEDVDFRILKLPLYSGVTRSQSWSLVDHQNPCWTEELKQANCGGEPSELRGWEM